MPSFCQAGGGPIRHFKNGGHPEATHDAIDRSKHFPDARLTSDGSILVAGLAAQRLIGYNATQRRLRRNSLKYRKLKHFRYTLPVLPYGRRSSLRG